MIFFRRDEGTWLFIKWHSYQNRGIGFGAGIAFGGLAFGGLSWLPLMVGLSVALIVYGFCEFLLNIISEYTE